MCVCVCLWMYLLNQQTNERAHDIEKSTVYFNVVECISKILHSYQIQKIENHTLGEQQQQQLKKKAHTKWKNKPTNNDEEKEEEEGEEIWIK